MSIPTEQAQQGEQYHKGSQTPASIRQVLKNKHFLRLWMAQIISQTVLNAANYGLIVLVGNNTLLTSLAVIVFNLPAIPFSAVAGVIVDKLNKRQVLWISNLLRMVITLVMFGWLLLNRSNIWPLFAFLYITSLIGQFFIPAEGSSIPLLVGERELMPALSLFNVTITLSMALGFMVLGNTLLILLPPFTLHFGLHHALTIQPVDMLYLVIAVLYLVCVLLIHSIPKEAFYEKHRERAGQLTSWRDMDLKPAFQSFWHDMIGGWQIIRMDRILFFSVIQLSIVGVIMQLIGAQAAPFVKTYLNQPPKNMALILAPAAVGLVGASAFMPRITELVGKVRLAFVGLLSLAVGFAILTVLYWIAFWLDPKVGTAAPFFFALVLIIVFLLGIAMAGVNIPTQTMMQERSPEDGRARVLSLQYMLFSVGTIPTLSFAGALGVLLGFSQMILVVAIAIFLFWVWGIYYLYHHAETAQEVRNIDSQR